MSYASMHMNAKRMRRRSVKIQLANVNDFDSTNTASSSVVQLLDEDIDDNDLNSHNNSSNNMLLHTPAPKFESTSPKSSSASSSSSTVAIKETTSSSGAKIRANLSAGTSQYQHQLHRKTVATTQHNSKADRTAANANVSDMVLSPRMTIHHRYGGGGGGGGGEPIEIWTVGGRNRAESVSSNPTLVLPQQQHHQYMHYNQQPSQSTSSDSFYYEDQPPKDGSKAQVFTKISTMNIKVKNSNNSSSSNSNNNTNTNNNGNSARVCVLPELRTSVAVNHHAPPAPLSVQLAEQPPISPSARHHHMHHTQFQSEATFAPVSPSSKRLQYNHNNNNNNSNQHSATSSRESRSTSSSSSSDRTDTSDQQQQQQLPSPTSSRSNSQRGALEISSKPVEDISYEELTPSGNTARDVELCYRQLSSDKWDTQLSGIILARRLAKFHSSVLVPRIHQFVVLLTGFVNNLRSSLSKNAIICYNEMFMSMGKEIDGELEFIVPSLMRKTAEANRFINSEAEKALQSIIEHSSPEKSLYSLLQFSDQKSASIRSTSAMLLNECVRKCQARIIKSKDFGRLLQAVSRYLDDGSFESRKWGRTLAYNIAQVCEGQSEFDSLLRKHLSDVKVKTFLDAARKGIPVSGAIETRNRFIPRLKHVSSKNSVAQKNLGREPLFGDGNIANNTNNSNNNHLNNDKPGGGGGDRSNNNIGIGVLRPSNPIRANYRTMNTSAGDKATTDSVEEPIRTVTPPTAATTAPRVRAAKSAPTARSVPYVTQVNKQPLSSKRAASASSGLNTNTNTNTNTNSSNNSNYHAQLQTIYKHMDSPDWIIRNQGTTQLQDFVFENSRNIFAQADLTVQMFDHLLPRLADPNSKVNMFAYQTLIQIIPILAEYVEPVSLRILQAICVSLSSSNNQTRSLSEEAFSIMIEFVPLTILVPLIPPMMSSVKNREVVLENIQRNKLMEKVYRERPALIQRYIIPMVCKNFRDGGHSLRNAYLSLLKTIHLLYNGSSSNSNSNSNSSGSSRVSNNNSSSQQQQQQMPTVLVGSNKGIMNSNCSSNALAVANSSTSTSTSTRELMDIVSQHVSTEDYVFILNFLHKR